MPVDDGLPRVGAISAIVGDSRTGKTYAVDRYARQFEPSVGETGVNIPVLTVDTPSQCSNIGLALAFAEALGYPATQKMSLAVLQKQIPAKIVERNVQLIILDEAQEAFDPKRKHVLNFTRSFLRKILNTKQVGIVCVGLPETYYLIAEDKQLAGRGGLPYRMLEPYDWANEHDRKCFRLLCKKFDAHLPFDEKSGLSNTVFAQRLFYVCEGNIGRLKDFIADAAYLAMNEHACSVGAEHFANAYDIRMRPGERFNPFRHDLSQAPRADAEKAKERPSREAFKKALA